jgi:uncharacterized membrane protein (UPF0127 family)
VQQARKRVEIRFMEYLRVGALITAVTIAIGILVLAFEAKPANGAETDAMERSVKHLTAIVLPVDTHTLSRAFDIVLICDTEATRAKGLQGFRRFRTNEAALFLFEKPETATFWMGSVGYPIDIIFIGSDKKVVRVYPNCMPGSRDLYYSPGRVTRVIETAAGSGINVGDEVNIE